MVGAIMENHAAAARAVVHRTTAQLSSARTTPLREVLAARRQWAVHAQRGTLQRHRARLAHPAAPEGQESGAGAGAGAGAATHTATHTARRLGHKATHATTTDALVETGVESVRPIVPVAVPNIRLEPEPPLPSTLDLTGPKLVAAVIARARWNARFVQVRRSRIDGWGLFVTKDFAPDDVILEYLGEVISLKVAELRQVKYEAQGVKDYMFKLSRTHAVDATVMAGHGRFINHSCDPNCFVTRDTIPDADGMQHLFVYSREAIRAGDELTYDYSFSPDEQLIVCNCSSSVCRGTLNLRKTAH